MMRRRGQGEEWPAAVYRMLLVAAPKRFRAVYADEMVLVFTELHRDATRQGVAATVGVWFRAFTQAVGSGLAERFGWRASGPKKRSNKPTARKGATMVDRLIQDLHYAVRSFRRQPGFFATVVGILALGIGAATAIFSVVDGVLLKRMPFPEPEQLVYFDDGAHTVPDFQEWREQFSSFEMIAGFWITDRTMLGNGRPLEVSIGQTTAETFSVFGVIPYLGRFITETDVQENLPVVFLSHGFWRNQFNGDPSVLGRSVDFDGRLLEIIGVGPADFLVPNRMAWSGPVDAWTPLDVNAANLNTRNFHVLRVLGRLKPDATLEQARQEMTVWEEWAVANYEEWRPRSNGIGRTVPLLLLQEAEVGEVKTPLYMLLGAVGLLLLVACANVANLLLARGADRTREFAVRGALGGSRARLLGQLLTESFLLAVAAGVIGAGLALVGVRTFLAFAPDDIPRVAQVALDLRVLAFTLGVALVTGVLFGIAPAVYAARTDIQDALKEAGTRASAGRGRMRLKGVLVSGEIAMALMLLVGAGLLFNSFIRLIQVDPGFEPEHVMAVPISFGSMADFSDGDEGVARLQVVKNLVTEVGALPGVENVTGGLTAPFVMNGRCCMATQSASPSGADTTVHMIQPALPGYFDALGIQIVAGRGFTWGAVEAAAKEIVIAREIADLWFPDGNAVGNIFIMGTRDPEPYTIVGVANDAKFSGLTNDDNHEVFVPYDAEMAGEFPFMYLVVRTSGPVEGLRQQIRDVVWALAPDMPVPELPLITERIAETTTNERFLSTLVVVFATLAVMLAAAGIYGTMLYAVRQQRHDFGIRMALGADQPRILRSVLKTGAVLTGIGIVVGLAGAWGLARVLENMLFGIGTTDIPTYGAVTVLLSAVAMAACYLPARRAAQQNPMEALRSE